jgi:DDE superfamily endonuclease
MASLTNARSASDRVVAFLDFVDASESEGEYDANIDVASLFVGASMLKRPRCAPILCEWLTWERHVCLLNQEGHFTQMYRMSYTSYCKLLKMLSPAFEVDVNQGNHQSQGQGHISSKLILHCLIRYMAGGSFHDIRTFAGIAKATFFNCIHWVIDAVNNCPALAIEFPTDPNGLKQLAVEFQGKSSMGVLDGCVGALDRWLCHIKVPTAKDTANIAAYFSGHYQHHGVNVQACCNATCKFTYLSIRSPGGTGDTRVFAYGTALQHFLEVIPRGFYVVADSAYTLSSTLLVPFSGAN